MIHASKMLRAVVMPIVAALLATSVFANEDAIRRNLKSRLADLPAIKSVTPTPVAGIFEVVLEGNTVVYTDRKGDHLFEGTLLQTATRTNLTQARTDKLNAIKFSQLELNDAFTVVKGTGEKKLAVLTIIQN